jgi:hypothetical protein
MRVSFSQQSRADSRRQFPGRLASCKLVSPDCDGLIGTATLCTQAGSPRKADGTGEAEVADVLAWGAAN